MHDSRWRDIESAPKTGRTLLLGYWNSHGKWRTVRGQWMSAEYIGQEWDEPDGVEAGWFETAVEADDVPNCWPVSPSHWQPMPAPPCPTCNDQGAVGNVLNAEPCPECSAAPASAQEEAVPDARTRVMEVIAGVWDHATQIDDAADEVIEMLSPAPAAGDARDARDTAIGAAIGRACAELPFGYSIELLLEDGYGGARLIDPEGMETDLDQDERELAKEINAGIDAALAAPLPQQGEA